jgi:hypothetical protein
MALVDVVNLNGDASCLSAAKWLRCLEGGTESQLMRVLSSYVHAGRKVNLGPVGATAMDMVRFNPESIDYINRHPEIFEIVLRPFAHDNALLRLPQGFRFNAETGVRVLRRMFVNVSRHYLAPEIMVTGEQIRILAELEVEAVFVHKGRYDVGVARHIPDHPFSIRGVFGTPMLCIPFASRDVETAYLQGLHGTFTPARWAETAARAAGAGETVIWRDGESCLLHPLAPDFEAQMLDAEAAAGVERRFLSDLPATPEPELADGKLRYFPLHSMKPWMEAMKLFWFIDRTRRIEESLSSISEEARRLWLLTINSDILSAAEKGPPIVTVIESVLSAPASDPLWEGVVALPESRHVALTRSERAGEGEDYLAYAEALLGGDLSFEAICERWRVAEEPHLRKAWARVVDL